MTVFSFGYKYLYLPALFLLILVSSCTPTKNLGYFKDLKDSSRIYSQIIQSTYELKLQPDDIVQILINSVNPEATAVFNLGNTTPAIGSTAHQSRSQGTPDDNISHSTISDPTGGNKGYLVDKNGGIDFPVLGRIKVMGLTTTQLKEQLKTKLDTFLMQPIVNVRLLNYRITVLGEVAHPASYAIPGDHITVIEALGMAGDLTIYGKRENVLLVREENGQRRFIRLNLNSSDLFRSPYYYLKQNDALYIEPDASKLSSLDTGFYRKTSLVISVLTLLVLITYRIILK
ncbi:MAG: polysaccharide biosynthesis/export family protein [Ferruginibacter sp.]